MLLVGCKSPSPADCRAAGVAVKDGAKVTGEIVEENMGTPQQVRAICQSPFEARYGCAMVVFPGEYVIWYVDDQVAKTHEICHGLYETKEHTP